MEPWVAGVKASIHCSWLMLGPPPRRHLRHQMMPKMRVQTWRRASDFHVTAQRLRQPAQESGKSLRNLSATACFLVSRCGSCGGSSGSWSPTLQWSDMNKNYILWRCFLLQELKWWTISQFIKDDNVSCLIIFSGLLVQIRFTILSRVSADQTWLNVIFDGISTPKCKIFTFVR